MRQRYWLGNMTRTKMSLARNWFIMLCVELLNWLFTQIYGLKQSFLRRSGIAYQAKRDTKHRETSSIWLVVLRFEGYEPKWLSYFKREKMIRCSEDVSLCSIAERQLLRIVFGLLVMVEGAFSVLGSLVCRGVLRWWLIFSCRWMTAVCVRAAVCLSVCLFVWWRCDRFLTRKTETLRSTSGSET